VAAYTVALAGCGAGGRAEVSQYPIKGTVQLDANPLPDGEIMFVNKEKGVPVTLAIKNGSYEGKAPAGTNKVEIRAYKSVETKAGGGYQPPGGGSTKENFLPKKWNEDSKEKADVTSDATKNVFDFKVTSD
jgi:hypothetical protein